ncbi:hypothetical protein [Dactylosporangium sp. CA-233914]|uniref:hypothetical protein n=1 Tax=Dactylosporangium sp. CA-233914 TaxID=3239934 RepID=UPI003D8FF49F
MYGKALAGSGRRAVVLLNRTGSAATMPVRRAGLGLSPAAGTVRNAWTGPSTTGVATSYGVSVPAGASVFLTVTGTENAAGTYEAEASGNTRGGSAPAARPGRRSATSATAQPCGSTGSPRPAAAGRWR